MTRNNGIRTEIRFGRVFRVEETIAIARHPCTDCSRETERTKCVRPSAMIVVRVVRPLIRGQSHANYMYEKIMSSAVGNSRYSVRDD